MNRKKRKARNRPKVLFILHPSSFILSMSLYLDANAYAGLHLHNRANH